MRLIVVLKFPKGFEQVVASTRSQSVCQEDDSADLKPRPHRSREQLKRLKRLLYYNMPPKVEQRLKTWTAKLLEELPQSDNGGRNINQCWIHPAITTSQANNKAITTEIQIDHVNRISIQFGHTMLLLHNKITDEQKSGIIEESWHLSHICGNFRCLNLHHFTIEPGSVNQNRKICHNKSKGRACVNRNHKPRCFFEPSDP
ncbi:hypothetical protein EJ08DRAFT_105578 [Tothia fuscella]|uniref:Zinc-binding loop region of homing endonuclease domain-containing protein n=1 Tax=Tothia fuscella TaxID=1048955 RepID=A0A9P4NWP8_9PEZI|nr:hypothetical protein EJ08DRAFT_105578 [Tothia fuscella]